MGGLIGISSIKKDANIARINVPGDINYFAVIPVSVRRCSYLVTVLEDRSQPKIFVVSKYDVANKIDYKVNAIINGYSVLSIHFYYDSIGNFILSTNATTRAGVASVKLIVGETEASIEKITPSVSDLTEIPIA